MWANCLPPVWRPPEKCCTSERVRAFLALALLLAQELEDLRDHLWILRDRLDVIAAGNLDVFVLHFEFVHFRHPLARAFDGDEIILVALNHDDRHFLNLG